MLTIAQTTRFYQLFTAPDVFGRMWSLDPSLRDDNWYKRLLPLLPGDLLEIPWARTGRRYDRPEEPSDQYPQAYHAYGTWLRGDLRDQILKRVNGDPIRTLGLLNERSLDRALSAWGRAGTASTNSLDELMAWLASLHDLLEKHGVEPDGPLAAASWTDTVSVLRGGGHVYAYIYAREWLRD